MRVSQIHQQKNSYLKTNEQTACTYLFWSGKQLDILQRQNQKNTSSILAILLKLFYVIYKCHKVAVSKSRSTISLSGCQKLVHLTSHEFFFFSYSSPPWDRTNNALYILLIILSSKVMEHSFCLYFFPAVKSHCLQSILFCIKKHHDPSDQS